MKLGHGKLKTVNSLEGAVDYAIEQGWGITEIDSVQRCLLQVRFGQGQHVLGVVLRIILKGPSGKKFLVKLQEDFGYLRSCYSARCVDYLQLGQLLDAHAFLCYTAFAFRFSEGVKPMGSLFGSISENKISDLLKAAEQTIQSYQAEGRYVPITERSSS